MAAPVASFHERASAGALAATVLLGLAVYVANVRWHWAVWVLGLFVAVPLALLWQRSNDLATEAPAVVMLLVLGAGVVAKALGSAYITTWFVGALVFVPLAHYVGHDGAIDD